mmetsp:Transcript_45248/g.127968  ORF Transcript_45248/g.127968 Transcript_45248/m.127968 type:complete len:602 (+) Transcript_45248:301-2106(+)
MWVSWESNLLLWLLFSLSNVLGVFLHFGLGADLVPMLPVSCVSFLALVRCPSLASMCVFALYAAYWFPMRSYPESIFSMLARKDWTLIKYNLRKLAYTHFDHVGYASLELPAATQGRPEPGKVRMFRTGKGTGDRMTEIHYTFDWTPGNPPKGDSHVIINSDVRFQHLLGFGGAFTESSASLFKKMGPKSQEKILDGYFSKEHGVGYRIGRLHMNSCDFSRGNWACCEKDGDTKLETFTTARYDEEVFPMAKRAFEVAGQPLTLFASPWSPAAWMKDNQRMTFGGHLKPDCFETWAQHFVKFAEACKEAGLPLWGFTVQNEPDNENRWENCLFNAEEERDFVRDHLGPAFEASGLDLKIICWDHNRDDMCLRAQTIYSDPEASKYVWGMGYHWYGDPRHDWWADFMDNSCFDNVRRVHELQPDKHLIVTEVCQEQGAHMGDWFVGERYGESILRDMNNWNEAFCDWNLILDEEGGPNHVDNMCSAPIIVDVKKDKVFFQPSFFYIGQFARFMQEGAQCIFSSSSRAQLEVTSWANPDGTIVVVVLNQTSNLTPFYLVHGGYKSQTWSDPHSITTYWFQADHRTGVPVSDPAESTADGVGGS